MSASRIGSPLRSRTISFVCSRPPSLIRAWRRASGAVMPARKLSSMCNWRWLSSSAASSLSRRSLRKSSPRRNSHVRNRLIVIPRDSNRSEDLPAASRPATTKSFVAQRNHRVDTRGASGGEVTCRQRDGPKKGGHHRKCHWIGGLNTKQQSGHRARKRQRHDETDCHAQKGETRAFPQNRSQDVRSMRSQSHANSDFMHTLADGICHDAVNADHCQNQRENGKDGKENRTESRARHRFVEQLIHRTDVSYRKLVIQGQDCGLKSGNNLLRSGRTTDDDVHFPGEPRAPAGIEIGNIHCRLILFAQTFVFHIAHNADNRGQLPFGVVLTGLDSCAYRVLIREISPGHIFIDD